MANPTGVAAAPGMTVLLCPWTREALLVKLLRPPLSGAMVFGPFWQSKIFLTEASLLAALTPRKGQSMRKAGYAEPRLVCPFTGDPLTIVEHLFTTPITGDDRVSPKYQIIGPFWTTRWYDKKEHLEYDISQLRGVQPTFLRDHLEVVGVRAEPELMHEVVTTEQMDRITGTVGALLDEGEKKIVVTRA